MNIPTLVVVRRPAERVFSFFFSSHVLVSFVVPLWVMRTLWPLSSSNTRSSGLRLGISNPTQTPIIPFLRFCSSGLSFFKLFLNPGPFLRDEFTVADPRLILGPFFRFPLVISVSISLFATYSFSTPNLDIF